MLCMPLLKALENENDGNQRHNGTRRPQHHWYKGASAQMFWHLWRPNPALLNWQGALSLEGATHDRALYGLYTCLAMQTTA